MNDEHLKEVIRGLEGYSDIEKKEQIEYHLSVLGYCLSEEKTKKFIDDIIENTNDVGDDIENVLNNIFNEYHI